MTILRGSRRAQASSLAVTFVAIAALWAHGAATASAATAPAPAVRTAAVASALAPTRSRRPAAIPGLGISITDGRTSVQPGDRLAYTVRVKNSGPTAVPSLTITQTLLPGLKFITASRDGVAAAGKVTWHTRLPAGRTVSFSVSAQVTRVPAGVLRLAAVACAAVKGGPSLVCAAHLDRLPAAAAAAAQARQSGGTAGRTPRDYAVIALAVLAAAGLAVIGGRRIRLRRGPRPSARPARPDRRHSKHRV